MMRAAIAPAVWSWQVGDLRESLERRDWRLLCWALPTRWQLVQSFSAKALPVHGVGLRGDAGERRASARRAGKAGDARRALRAYRCTRASFRAAERCRKPKLLTAPMAASRSVSSTCTRLAPSSLMAPCVLQLGEHARDGLQGEPEIVGDIVPRHGELDAPTRPWCAWTFRGGRPRRAQARSCARAAADAPACGGARSW